MSCAETQHPETTLASKSLLKTGFRRATQMEVEVELIWLVSDDNASVYLLNSFFLVFETSSFFPLVLRDFRFPVDVPFPQEYVSVHVATKPF